MKERLFEERKRIARLLDHDKEDMNDESRAAAARDFGRVAREYFDVEGEPVLTVGRDRDGFGVTLTFRAARVKNFTTLK